MNDYQLSMDIDDFRKIVNQRDFMEKMLEIFETVENPSQKVKEKLEVIYMIVETLDDLIDELCKVKEYYDMFNIIESGD
jgi:hypothetical protein